MFSKFTRFLPNPLSHIISVSHSHYDQNEYQKHIGKVMTKKEFFETFPDFKIGKVMHSNLTHKGHTYKMGLNTIDQFNPSGCCSQGGFYVTDATKLFHYHHTRNYTYDDWGGYSVVSTDKYNLDCGYGNNIATISLPDDTLIYLEECGKIKVSKLILHEITPIDEYYDRLTPQEQLKCIQNNPYLIQFISNPSDDLQIEAINLSQYDSMIPYIKNLSYNAMMFAVTHDDRALSYIENPDTQIQLMAVRHFPSSIQYISSPSKEVQLEAVKQDVNAIYYIQGFPHIEAILLAIKLYITK